MTSTISKRQFIGGVSASLLASSLPAYGAVNSLAQLAASKGITFGSALDYPDNRIFNNSTVAKIYRQQCAQFVMGHQLILGHNQRSAGSSFSFAKADRAVSFARKSGIPMAGHAAIWHNFAPSWLGAAVKKHGAQKVIEDHVHKVVGRYRGKMKYWVVVNEPFDWQKRRSDYIIPTPYAEGLGAEYIDVAFAAAAKADPNVRLVLNEVGMEHDYPDAARKRKMMIQTIKRLKKKGIPIHAVGIQGHLRPQYPFSKSKFRGFLNQISRLGLKIMITELDVDDNSLPTEISQRDKLIAKQYSQFLDVCLSNKACDHIIMWGLINKWNWLNLPEQPKPKGLNKYSLQLPRSDKTPHRPTLYDDNLQPTAAWHAVAQSLQKAKAR